MPMFYEHCDLFSRARSNLILSCLSEEFPKYMLFRRGKGKKARYRGKRRRSR